MSLTSLLRSERVRGLVDDNITKPILDRRMTLKVPPRSNTSPRLIGTVFDYIFRLGLSEHAGSAVRFDSLIASKAEAWRGRPLIRKRICQARDLLARHAVTTQTGKLSRYAARACYYLGQLEVVYRAGITWHLESEPTEDEIRELEDLFAVVPWAAFLDSELLLLNPTFGEGSVAVGGADADLYLDGGLVEIKTHRALKLRREWIRQLVGYALLARRFGLHTGGHVYWSEIRRVGVYFARAGELVWFPFRDIISPSGETAIINGGFGFVKMAIEEEEIRRS